VSCDLAQDRICKADLLFSCDGFGVLDRFVDNGVLAGDG